MFTAKSDVSAIGCANAQEWKDVYPDAQYGEYDGDNPDEQWPDDLPDDTVPEGWACPNCHENRMDYLVWDDDGTHVTCTSCNTIYTLV